MPLPPLLCWLVSPFASPHPQESHITEQINPTYIASSPAEEDHYWPGAVKYFLLALVCLKHLCYSEDLKLLCSKGTANTPGTLITLCRRIIMDILPPIDSAKKRCSSCLRILPATAEYFPRNKNRKDGLYPQCKQCRAAYYTKHKQHVSDRGKRYRQEHSEEKRERDREYRAKNHEAWLAKKKLYRELHAEELAAKQRKYYLEHHTERLIYKQNYNQTERGIIAKRADSHNRRARRKKAPGSHTTEQLYQQFMRQHGKCFYCQVELQHARNSWHADHIIPLSRGGSNNIENIVIACPTCNRKKHDKLPHEWQNGGEI